jgi:hypothetical protein
MSDVEFFCFKGILIQNFNTVDLVEFLEKNKKLHIQIVAAIIKMTSCKTIRKRKKVKKGQKPRFYGQNKLLS